MRRPMLKLMVAFMVSAFPLATAITPARADSASTFLGLVNNMRASHGLGPLYPDPTLTSVAQSWSAHMALTKALGHNPNQASQSGGGWTKQGENVGAGGSINLVFNSLASSPFHLANMLDPTYNLTGIGVTVDQAGTLWVAEDFEAKPGAVPALAPPPATTRVTSRPPTAAQPTAHGPMATTVTTPAPNRVTTAPHGSPTAAATFPPTPTGATRGVGAPPGVDPAVQPTPSKLAAALPAHKSDGGSSPATVLAFAALILVSLGSAGFLITRRLRSGAG